MADNPFDDQSKDTIKRLFEGNPITAGAAERMLSQLGAKLKKNPGQRLPSTLGTAQWDESHYPRQSQF